MRLRLTLLRGLAVVIAMAFAPGLAAQRQPAPARGGLPAADTLDLEVTGVPQVPDRTFRSRLVRRYEAEANGALLVRHTELTQIAEGGTTGLRVRERTTVDARTGTLRASWRRTELSDGTTLEEASHTVNGARVRLVRQRQTGPADTTVGAFPADGAPIASFDDLLRIAPLTPAWRGRYEVFTAGPPFHATLVVDSTRVPDGSSRASWTVFAHLDSASGSVARVVAEVESATQVAQRVEWWRADGTHTIVTNTSALQRAPAEGPLTGTIDSSLVGHYVLEGEREVGSELRLAPDGRFAYMLAYGALDESATGQWRRVGDAVMLRSDPDRVPVPARPTGAPPPFRLDGAPLRVEPGVLLLARNGHAMRYVRR